MSHVIYLTPKDTHSFHNESYYASADHTHFWCAARFDFLKDDLNAFLKPGMKFLEIGCGNGVVRTQVETAFAEVSVDGADVCVPALEMNPLNLRGKTYFYDIFEKKSELKEHFDALLLFDVLEHLPNPDAFLQAALHHLKPGGKIYLNVPALQSLWSQYDAVQGHQKRYHSKELFSELNHANLEQIQIRYWGFFMIPILFLRKLLENKNADPQTILRQGFAKPNAILNALLYLTLRIEKLLLPSPPAGTSLFAIAQKKV